MQHRFPGYWFNFGTGISVEGIVTRTSSGRTGHLDETIQYRIDDSAIAAVTGNRLSSIVADFLDICFSTHVADRHAPRRLRGSSIVAGDDWYRKMHVILPVRNVDFWQIPEISSQLTEILRYLTDDEWDFEFRFRTSLLRPIESQLSLFPPSVDSPVVILNSGGLDSLCGLSKLALEGSRPLLPVTLKTNPHRVSAAEVVVEELRMTAKSETVAIDAFPVLVHVTYPGRVRSRNFRESSQRARALLCLGIGVAAALSAGVRELCVCENGIGALSLPMNTDHWGARATRAVHPKTLFQVSSLVSRMCGEAFKINNIGLMSTKGELVDELLHSPFHQLIHCTTTCDRAAYLPTGRACGKCTSCILRRIALVGSELGIKLDGSSNYQFDLGALSQLRPKRIASHFVAMRYQIEELRATLSQGDGFAGLSRAFPDLIEIHDLANWLGLKRRDLEMNVVRLFSQYDREFLNFTSLIAEMGQDRPIMFDPSTRNLAQSVAS